MAVQDHDNSSKTQSEPQNPSEEGKILYPRWDMSRPTRERDERPQLETETVQSMPAVRISQAESNDPQIDAADLLKSTEAELWDETRRSIPEELVSAFDNPSLVVRVKLSEGRPWSINQDYICTGLSDFLSIVQEEGQATPCRFELVPVTDAEGKIKRGDYIVQAYPLYMDEDEVLEGQRFFICEVKIFNKKTETAAVQAAMPQDEERETVEADVVEEEPEEVAPEGESINISIKGDALRQFLMTNSIFSDAWNMEERLAKTRTDAENKTHIPLGDGQLDFTVRNNEGEFTLVFGGVTYPSEIFGANDMPAWVEVILNGLALHPEIFPTLDHLNNFKLDRKVLQTLLKRVELPVGTEGTMNFAELYAFLPNYVYPGRKLLVTFGSEFIILHTQQQLKEYFRIILKGSGAEVMNLQGLQFDFTRVNNVEDQIVSGRNTVNGRKEFELVSPLKITRFEQHNGDTIEKTIQKIADENKEVITNLDLRNERIKLHVHRVVEEKLAGVNTIDGFNERSEVVTEHFDDLIGSTPELNLQIARALEIPQFYVDQASLNPRQINGIRDSIIGTLHEMLDEQLEEHRQRILKVQLADTVIEGLKANNAVRGLIVSHSKGLFQFKKQSNAENTIDGLKDTIAETLEGIVQSVKEEYQRLTGVSMDLTDLIPLMQYEVNPLYADDADYAAIDRYLEQKVKKAGLVPFGTVPGKFDNLKARYLAEDELFETQKAKPVQMSTELIDLMYAKARRGPGITTFRTDDAIKKDFVVLLKLRDKIARSIKSQIGSYIESTIIPRLNPLSPNDKVRLSNLFCNQIVESLKKLEPILVDVELDDEEIDLNDPDIMRLIRELDESAAASARARTDIN